MKRNLDYEAGYIRSVDHEQGEVDSLDEEARVARRRKLFVLGGALVVAAIAATFGLRALNDSPGKQLERARRSSASNAHAAAIVEVKRSLLDEPNQPAARALLGHELLLLGDWKGAEIEFRKALEARYEPDEIYPQLVTCLLRQERFEKVVTTVTAATVVAPATNAELQAQLGTAYYALGREKDAELAWQAAKRYVPGHAGALLAEATALVAKGSFAAANTVLDAIPPTAPRQEQRLALRGDIARATGHPDDAAKAYERAVALEPGNLVLRASLADTDLALGRYDDAAQHVRAILAVTPTDPRAEFLAARVAYGRKDFVAAKDAITKAIQQMPREGRAHLMAGRIALDSGRLADAELHLREAVALLPRTVDARLLLADLYLQRHEADKADDTIRPAFTATPEDKRLAAVVARIAMLQDDPAKAAKAYDAVDAADPANVDASLAAAALKFAAGDRTGAFARLRAASLASPADADIDTALVTSHLQLHQTKEALTAWNALAAKRPADARTWTLLSTIDLERGDRAAARRSLEKALERDARDVGAVGALASLDVADGRIDDARDRLRRFVASGPATVEPLLQLVRLEQGPGGRDDQVLPLLREARKIDPRSLPVARALVAYLVAHDDPKQALATADEALANAPNDIALLQSVGEIALATGDHARAIASFSKLTALNAQSADYPARLGNAQLAASQFEPALTAYRTALQRQPDNAERQTAMIASLLAARRTDEADRLQFEIARLAPKSPALAEIDGDLKLARKRYPEAVDAYRAALATKPTSRLALKTIRALGLNQERSEAAALLADWIRAHPNDEAARQLDVDRPMQASQDTATRTR